MNTDDNNVTDRMAFSHGLRVVRRRIMPYIRVNGHVEPAQVHVLPETRTVYLRKGLTAYQESWWLGYVVAELTRLGVIHPFDGSAN